MKQHRVAAPTEIPTPADVLAGAGPILPEQYFGSAAGTRRRGVHRLFAAVLADGVQLFCESCRRKDPEGQRLAVETEQWIESNDRTHLFSFLNLCHALDVDPVLLRRRLRRWRADRPERGSSSGCR